MMLIPMQAMWLEVEAELLMSPRPGSGRKLSSRINHWLNLEINKKQDRDKAAIKYDLVANLKIS